MTFIRVKIWSWKHFFLGQQTTATNLDATEQQVRDWIEKSTSRGGGGNYDPESLKCIDRKVKERYVTLTPL